MRQLAGDLRSVSSALIWAAALMVAAGEPAVSGESPERISFSTSDEGQIRAHLYGSGDRAVVLAHGRVFDKESWQPLAARLVEDGLRVLALDFRGYGDSIPGSAGKRIDLDVLGAVDYLEGLGVSSISLVGASMGGWAVGAASSQCAPGRIHKVILLAPAPIENPGKMRAGEFFYIASQGEGSIDRIRSQYASAPEPKHLQLLPGKAHAQHVFKTDQAEALTAAIVAALEE